MGCHRKPHWKSTDPWNASRGSDSPTGLPRNGDAMNDLNRLLQDWADRCEPSETKLDQLQLRVVEQLTVIRRTPPREQRSAGWIAVVSVAASLLAAMLVFWGSRRDTSSRPVDLASELPPASDLSARQPLFVELDRMFDGRWRWLSEVNGRVHLQTDESNDVSTEPGMAMRLVVVRRRPGETKWSVVWEASVLTRGDEWVQLPDELTGDNVLSVWAHALPDGSVLVESDVALTAPVAVRLSEQQVFEASARPARLWSARRPDGEFQLIQTIARLEAHHG